MERKRKGEREGGRGREGEKERREREEQCHIAHIRHFITNKNLHSTQSVYMYRALPHKALKLIKKNFPYKWCEITGIK